MNLLDSIVDGALALPDQAEADALIGAVVRFMRTGEEPEALPGAAAALWIAVEPVVRNSRSRSIAGRAGGSANACEGDGGCGSAAAVDDESKPSSKTPSKRGSKTASKPSSKTRSKGASEQVSSLPSPDSSIQEVGCGEGERPDPREVATYFAGNCLRGDPSEFFDHFESQGWMRSNGMPVLDWRAQARMWSRRQVEFDASKPPDLRQPEAPLQRAVNAIDYDAELARLDAELARMGDAA